MFRFPENIIWNWNCSYVADPVGVDDAVRTIYDHFAAAVKAGVKQARAQVYSDLKNKPTHRAGIGI